MISLSKLADLVIANSEASKKAFIQAGGEPDKLAVVYNGFDTQKYLCDRQTRIQARQDLNIDSQFVVGHFSRLSPWKGQHILIDALSNCPDNVVALLVGDALFGEDDYVETLHQQVRDHGLESRVKFVGFRQDVPELMSACDLVTHTSTAPEPFGRVIVEAMLCDRPIIASAAGGAVELVEHSETGWLFSNSDSQELAALNSHALTSILKFVSP